jgi:N6-adenosine-specific RNA methylase IME4
MKKLPPDVGRSTIKLLKPTVRKGQQFDLFDERPLTLKTCKLYARRVEIVGRPTLSAWTSDFEFVHATEESAGFWIGDLWNHAVDQVDWREKLPQALADIGLDVKIKTFYNAGHVARRVNSRKARKAAPSFGHAAVVADLPEDQQVALLAEADAKGWGVRDLMTEKRHRARPKIIEGQAALEGMYRVLYADPPWSYNDSGVITESDAYGRAARHFPSMPIEEMCKLPVEAHALPDAVFFCWVTAPLLLQNPGPREVIEAWGFTPKTGMVWDKVLHNFGHYVSVRHEHLIISTRGSCTPDNLTPMIDSVQTIRRGDVHSQKPEEFRRLIQQLYSRGPYLELFARERVEGWSAFGNDARLWGKEAKSA